MNLGESSNGAGNGVSVGAAAIAAAADRVCDEVRAALRRRPRGEAQLAGAVRVLGPLSENLRAELVEAVRALLRRGSWDRPLYCSAIRTLAEFQAPEASALLDEALARDGAGGLSSLSAATVLTEPGLDPVLRRVIVAGQPHLAFAAEFARAARGDSGGELLRDVAPKIKESHRIELCVELLVPLLGWSQRKPQGNTVRDASGARPALPGGVAPALAVLRSTERHLGRWLVLGQTGLAAADRSALEEAQRQAQRGPISSRPAWSLVAWALGAEQATDVRPNLELIARLSDRPSADKDTTFLFRMARARRPEARAMLDGLSRGGRPKDPLGVRAALRLAQQYGDARSEQALQQLARSAASEPLRAVTLAALVDLQRAALGPERSDAGDELAQMAASLGGARQLRAVCWAALAALALDTAPAAAAAGAPDLSALGPSICEANFRRLEYGWVQ